MNLAEFLPYFGMLMGCVVAPGIVFIFVYHLRKNKNEVQKFLYQKEILELELKKEELRVKAISEENKQYDSLLTDKINQTK